MCNRTLNYIGPSANMCNRALNYIGPMNAHIYRLHFRNASRLSKAGELRLKLGVCQVGFLATADTDMAGLCDHEQCNGCNDDCASKQHRLFVLAVLSLVGTQSLKKSKQLPPSFPGGGLSRPQGGGPTDYQGSVRPFLRPHRQAQL
jgi:hypothetical protein